MLVAALSMVSTGPDPPPERKVVAVSLPDIETLLLMVKFPVYVPGRISMESPATAMLIASVRLV